MKKSECPKCHNTNCIKDGFMRGKQRYKCKKCNYKHTVKHRVGTSTPQIKRLALHLYLEGLGFRSIGRLLNFSNVSILKWIRSFGEQVKIIKSEQKIKKMEIDEMHTYISKKTTSGYGYLLIELEKSLLILKQVQEV